MQVIENEKIVPFDIDNTIVIWAKGYNKPGKGKIKIKDGSSTYYLRPHKEHVDLLKRYNKRGFITILWSGNGYMWVEKVVKALKLEKYVTLITTKPMKFVDDCPAESWMQRIYIKEN